jgi:hypothetical protein
MAPPISDPASPKPAVTQALTATNELSNGIMAILLTTLDM